MKKIVSLALAGLMLVSMIPTAFAAETTDYTNGTAITLTGSLGESAGGAGASYTVTVPAGLAPGESGTGIASGNWASNQTLKVTAPNSVTLAYGVQTMDVGITFDGITQIGSDTDALNVSEAVSVEDASTLFGTWTGVLEYNVELVELITLTVSGVSCTAEAGMTWREWVNSDYYTGFMGGGGATGGGWLSQLLTQSGIESLDIAIEDGISI